MAGIWSFRLNFVKILFLSYSSRNLVLFNFRVDNARFFGRVAMNVSMTTVGQAACQLLCRYTQSTLAALAESYRLLRVSLSKELWLFMFEMHLVSGITDGWQGCEPHPLTKPNVKTRPLRSLYFGIYYSFGFSRLLFSYVFRSVFRWVRVFV